MVTVRSAEVLADYRLRLRFSDGTKGEVDLEPHLWGPVFEPLRDPAYFRRVSVSRAAGTIMWPNGADISPETLRMWTDVRTEPVTR
ncbi:MAG: DUF2442 domain-containing protein [Actinomycetota bacterium]